MEDKEVVKIKLSEGKGFVKSNVSRGELNLETSRIVLEDFLE